MRGFYDVELDGKTIYWNRHIGSNPIHHCVFVIRALCFICLLVYF
jgi:hypothetical protein